MGDIQEKFSKKFSGYPKVYRSPARINIIGEHVDYLGGLVLPAAIQFSTDLAMLPNSSNRYRIYSVHYDSLVEVETLSKQSDQKWANYILGVIDELKKEGYIFGGFDLVVDGNIPQGSGLSSSASLEVGVCFAISDCFKLGIPREKIAVIGQRAENNFVGTKCGIMDQFIISVGKQDMCILLDTETLSYSYTQLDMEGYEFYLVNSHVKHSLETSAYNQRRAECESAFRKLQTHFKNAKNLYSINQNEINFLDFQFTAEEHKRLKHVFGEKDRTREIIKAFSEKRMVDAAGILSRTHDSLSQLFEVSCEEIDFLQSTLLSLGVLGARMIGGGFGGCILVLDSINNRNSIEENVKKKYYEKYKIETEFYSFTISDGVNSVNKI